MIEMQYGLQPTTSQIQSIYLYPFISPTPFGSSIGTANIEYNDQTKTVHINNAFRISQTQQKTDLRHPDTMYQHIDVLIHDIIALYTEYTPNLYGEFYIHHYIHYTEWAKTKIKFYRNNNKTTIEYDHQHTPQHLIATRKPINNITNIHHLPTLYEAFYALQTDNLPLFDPTYDYQSDYIKYKHTHQEDAQNYIFTTLGIDKNANNTKIFTLHIDVETYQRRINLPMPNSDQDIQYIIQQLNTHTQKIITEYTNISHLSQHQIIHIIRALQHNINTQHSTYIQTMQHMRQQHHQHYI